MEYTIEAFVNKLIEEKGITGLSDEIVAELRKDLVLRAENMINAEILAHMPKEKLEEFEKKLDEGDEKEIGIFCKKNISNLDEVVGSALVKLKSIYLTGAVV